MRVRKVVLEGLAAIRGLVRTRRWGVRIHHGVKITGQGRLDLRPGSVIRPHTRIWIGADGTLTLHPRAQIGARSIIHVASKLEIGEGSRLSWNCQVMDTDLHTVVRQGGIRSPMTRPVLIGRNVLVGTGSLIFKGTEIGDNSVVAGGSVLAGRSFPPNRLIAGNPAEVRNEIDGWIP